MSLTPEQQRNLRALAARFEIVAGLLRQLAEAEVPALAKSIRLALIAQLGDIDDHTRTLHTFIFPDEED
jgi:hypothetical protein